MPSSVKDRLSNGYEFIFFFVKQKHYFFNLDKIRVPNKVVGVTDMRPPGILRQKLYPNSSYNKSDDPHLAQFKAKNKNAENPEALGSPRAREAREGYISYERKQNLITDIYSISKSIRGQSQYNTTATGNFLEGERNAKANRDALNILQQQEHLTAAELSFLKDYTQNHYGNPLGKNPGDVLELSTQPFKSKVHFAVFPPKLPEFCIKAGSSEEVCSACGKPKVPIIKITRPEGYEESLKETSKYENNIIRSAEINHRSLNSSTNIRPLSTIFKNSMNTKREIIGTKPTCTCNASFKPSVVLDPFTGSGTTMLVAKQLSKSAIGIEISEEYAKIIKQRLTWGFDPNIEWKVD